MKKPLRKLHFEEEDFEEPVFRKDIGLKEVENPEGGKDAAYRKSADIVPFFARDSEEDFRPPSTYTPGEVIDLSDNTNKALAFAEQSDFFGLCKPILWGSENEQQFGEMLRGLVIQFLPTNEFHLHLLRNVAETQWALERVTNYKKGIFSNNMDRPGAHGMAAGTQMGIEYTQVTEELSRQLRQFIRMYKEAKLK